MSKTPVVRNIVLGECLDVMRGMESDSVDLVFTSPPYEDARTYGIGFNKRGQEWVDWAVARYVECVRVCRGLVVWVVDGRTSRHRWSCVPALMMADLHRRGVSLRKPPIYARFGIPGSGGRDWLRNNYEFCIAASKGRLPWADNTAMGRAPKYPPGGAFSHRTRSGARVGSDGAPRVYTPPAKANPGNIIHCHGGGGHMGSSMAHENEAPFPEALAEFFVRSFCPPGGIVMDPFSGSGTTAAVAEAHGRGYVAIDIRKSQYDQTTRRVGVARENTVEAGHDDSSEAGSRTIVRAGRQRGRAGASARRTGRDLRAGEGRGTSGRPVRPCG